MEINEDFHNVMYGVEDVYDAFDDYEHPNSMTPEQKDANTVEDVIAKAEEYLNEKNI